MELILEHLIEIMMDTTQKSALMIIKEGGGTPGMRFARKPTSMESTITLPEMTRQEFSGFGCLDRHTKI